MPIDQVIAFALFTLAAAGTPGPSNVLLTATGAQVGLIRGIPALLGVAFGMGLMMAIVGYGLGAAVLDQPMVLQTLNWVGGAFLLWLAWKIANAAPPPESDIEGTPLTFLQAAAFQWVNPKAIYMAITAQTYYAPQGGGWIGAALVAGVFSMTNLPSVSVWAWLGVQMKRILGTGRLLRAFNITMALLLVATLIPLLQG